MNKMETALQMLSLRCYAQDEAIARIARALQAHAPDVWKAAIEGEEVISIPGPATSLRITETRAAVLHGAMALLRDFVSPTARNAP